MSTEASSDPMPHRVDSTSIDAFSEDHAKLATSYMNVSRVESNPRPSAILAYGPSRLDSAYTVVNGSSFYHNRSVGSPLYQQDQKLTFPTHRNVSALNTSKLMNQAASKDSANLPNAPDTFNMDKILARLSEQQAFLNRQSEALKSSEDDQSFRHHLDTGSSSNSLPITPATEVFHNTAPTTRPASANVSDDKENDEVLRLKQQLAQAQTQINKLEGIAQTQPGQPGGDQHGLRGMRSVPALSRASNWNSATDDTYSDTSEPGPISGFGRARGIWNNDFKAPSTISLGGRQPMNNDMTSPDWMGSRGPGTPMSMNTPFNDSTGPYQPIDSYRPARLTPEGDMLGRRQLLRHNRFENRSHQPPPFSTGFPGAFATQSTAFDAGLSTTMPGSAGLSHQPYAHMGIGLHPGNAQEQSTSLSPYASEFTSKAEWKGEVSPPRDYKDLTIDDPQLVAHEDSTYLPPTEPLNYRRLLDRNVNCNWKYIVDKIVCNNDQQASIFLQQKLKVGTPEQKYEMVEAIVAQAYPLMVNRFGNFLVQRCFEHGTPEQVIKIAESIRGNTLNLSMDPFGCHVVQKAFDSVPEDYKAIMVHELLRRIPETVIHRYACHVWQKLFELRWTESPPQIMKFVNEALQGMWHEVALGETGSLVVQNIFENCLEDDKRPCIEEVLANIDIVAHGQFGNWCIQHVCEHGAPPDKSRAIDHVIRYAAEYSTDQFASKVVEKCLKIGGQDFLGRYLDRVCEGRRDRTRIPLIDIASDQYGNYLVQWILNNASPQHREMVAAHIRKHMVSLRGSKFGSRVGMLCTNHAVATRPGPGVGPGMGGRPVSGPRYGAAAYR